MNIKELIQSSGDVYHRGKSHALAKELGTILLSNQMVTVYKNQTVIDISMMISGVSDMIKAGNSRSPVAYHKATISIKGVNQTYYSPSQLVSIIRATHREYADTEKYKNADVLKAALENPGGFFKDATIFRTTNDKGKGFSVVSNKISEDSEIQVWCSCSDYYWTFQYYNCDNNVDKYRRYPEKYIPKTKAGYEAFKQNTPVRNPSKSPGMCKHLMLLLATLMDKGVINDESNMKKYYKANYSQFQMESRLSISQYNARLNKWKKDQGLKVRQRAIERNKPGYRKSGWNWKTGKRTIKSNNGFNPFTGEFKGRKK